LPLNNQLSRQEIIQIIDEKAVENEVALLALYAYRQMDKINWKPFIIAALERNPVSLERLKGKTDDEAYQFISGLPNESVYDGQRLAQPDEVWNFGRGDGIEKAFVLANFLYYERKQQDLRLQVNRTEVLLESGLMKFSFSSSKELVKQVDLNK